MNEDYLWDKTGEADPEIEQLEQALSSLRFKSPAEPLPLPATTPRNLFLLNFPRPVLAAAAAILVLLLAGGLWLGLMRQTASTADPNAVANGTAPVEKRVEQAESGPRPPVGPQPAPNVVDPRDVQETASVPQAPGIKHKPQRRSNSGAQQLIVRRRAPRTALPRQEELARRGEEAKAQLIKALHIASDKLNEVQKKIQDNQEQRPIS